MIRSSKSGSDVRNKFLGAGEMAQPVKRTLCSFRGSRLGSQYPYSGLYPSVTLAVGDLTPFSDLHGYQRYTRAFSQAKHSYAQNQNKLIFKKKKKERK